MTIKYENSTKGKKTRKKYEHSEKRRLAKKKYIESKKGKLVMKKYRQSREGKITKKKSKATRKRNLGFIQMFPNPLADSEIIDWHHITNALVIAIPRDLHNQYLGKFHREKTMEIIKQIYL